MKYQPFFHLGMNGQYGIKRRKKSQRIRKQNKNKTQQEIQGGVHLVIIWLLDKNESLSVTAGV